MSETNRYTLFHRPSRNFLDWFDTVEEAQTALARWVAAAPENAVEIEVWDDLVGVQIEIDPTTLRPAPAA